MNSNLPADQMTARSRCTLTEASAVLAIAETYPHMVTVRISKDCLRALIEAARGKK